MARGDDDPVKRTFGGKEDLYDVATWDVRTRLDGLSVRMTGWLRAARTWILVVLALALFVAQIAVAGLLVLEEPTLGALGLLSVAPALGLAGYLWYGDPTRREPLEPLAVTFVLGVLFAGFAAVVNTLLSPVFLLFGVIGMPLFFFLVVAPIEETVKWLAIRVHAYRSETFDTVVDGVVYGAIAGLGFAAIENAIYISNTFLTTEQIDAAFQTAYVRAFVGPGHVIYSAFAGYYLGLAKFNPDNRGPIVVKGLLIAAFIHALYNTLVTFVATSGLALVAFVVVYDGFWLAVLLRKVTRYEGYYRRAQATPSEVDASDGSTGESSELRASGDTATRDPVENATSDPVETTTGNSADVGADEIGQRPQSELPESDESERSDDERSDDEQSDDELR